MLKEYPPYPENWVILEEKNTNLHFDGTDGFVAEELPNIYRSIKACVIDYERNNISIFYATFWLSMGGNEYRSSEEGWEHNVDQESGTSLSFEEFSDIWGRIVIKQVSETIEKGTF